METSVEVFLSTFHSLEGITIADRTKSFFILLHQNALFFKENPQLLDTISTNLIPTSYLESLFKVDFLIYFRRTEELLQVLKEFNDIFVSRITKHSWFFKEAFNDVPTDKFVNEVLPSMSFSVRMKVLRKLSRYLSDEKFEEIFDAVVERCGIFLASQFITGCGPEKVRATLSDYPIQLTSTQLRILHGKDRELISFYFENKSKNTHSSSYTHLFKFIYINDRPLFNYLKEKHNVSINLGRRATKRFVSSKKDEIIQQPFEYEFLNMKAVLRQIGSESLQLFINALPKTPEKCINRNWIFRSFPKRYHYGLFVKTFQSHYKIKYEDHPSLIDSELLRLISDVSERSKLAKVKIDKGEDDFIKFLRIEESIPLIKEKINVTSDICERGNLVKMLLQTCHINNDFSALFSVMKYFCFRHKNDDLQVHLKFIHDIESLFGFEKFTEEMWNCLNELLLIHMLKFNQSEQTYQKIQTLPLVSFNKGISFRQKLSYLQFLFKKGESIDELIEEYFTTKFEFPTYGEYDKDFGKYFLVFAINNIAKQTCEDKDLKFCAQLITEISKWNKHYEDNQLSLYNFPVLHHAFNYNIRKSDRHYKYSRRHSRTELEIFRAKIFTTIENVHRNEYMRIFWERFEYLGYVKDFRWFLNHDPLVLVENFETVFRKLTTPKKKNSSVRLKIWYLIKKFTHLHLDRMAVEACLTKIRDRSFVEKKSKFIPCLSVLMKPHVYATFADSHKPVNKKLDLENEEEVRLYDLQCQIASHFKNTKSHEVLSSLLNYCVGDYLKCALRSLYSLLYHTPEDELPHHLNHLSKQAVSVRKHALFLACELCTKSKVEETIRMLIKQEGVQSLQKHIFSSTMQYFLKNSSDQFFSLMKLTMINISKSDDESLRVIVRYLKNIPSKYKSEYILYSWKFLETIVDKWEELKPLKRDLLSHMTLDIVKDIPVEFAIRIIQQHFMTQDDQHLEEVDNLIFDVLVSKEEREIVFEKVFEIINRCSIKSEINNFFRSLYCRIMTSDESVIHLAPFVAHFEKDVTLPDRFLRYIEIFFMKIKLEFLEFNDFVEKVLMFFEEVIETCGTTVIHLFATATSAHLSYFPTKSITMYDIYYNMVKQRPVPDVAVLVLSAVGKPAIDDPCVGTFIKLLRLIRNIDDVGVEVYLLCNFKSFVKSHKILEKDESS